MIRRMHQDVFRCCGLILFEARKRGVSLVQQHYIGVLMEEEMAQSDASLWSWKVMIACCLTVPDIIGIDN